MLSEKKNSKEELLRTTQTEIAVLAYALRWKAACTPTQEGVQEAEPTHAHKDVSEIGTEDPPVSISRKCPFKPKRIAPPRTDINVESAIKGFQVDMERIVSRTRIRFHPNITAEQRSSIKELTSKNDITITRSDKGGEIVIMPTMKIHELSMEHLGDTATYHRLKKDPTQTLRLTINKTLHHTLNMRGFSPSIIQRLQTPPSAKTQRFYTLPKTHKETLKIRPIVSGRNGIFERLSWLLQLILKPLLKQVRAHISNTTELIAKFQECPRSSLQGLIPISFDVVSLYTNIDVEESISTALQLGQKYNIHTYGLTAEDVNELLHLLLENNIFEYPGYGVYQQIRGLAMGSRLSGTLAILTMDRFERLHIYRTIQPVLYVRYVDDTGTVVSSVTEAQMLLQSLNSKHGSIKFELELPLDDGHLPILDTTVKINADGSVAHRLYTKPASKRITLHYDSHHPDSIKRAIITNEIQRAIRNSSSEYRTDSIKAAINKLTNNGYPAQTIRSTLQKSRHDKRHGRRKTDESLTLRLPFISNKFNTEVRRALRRYNINARLVHPRPRTLLQMAQPKPKPPVCKLRDCPIKQIRCTTSYVIYEVTCEICKATYIGSTIRPLHDRAKEHVAAARKHSRASAVGEHYEKCHSEEEPQLQFRIVRATAKDELRLRIEEAMAIRTANPTMNRRGKDTGLDFLT